MHYRMKATIIGFFVIGAVVILIAIGIYQSEKQSLIKERTYVLFFSGSLKGVHPGSPVTHRGVKIGEVKDIVMEFNPKDGDITIPIFVQFYEIKDRQYREKTNLKMLIQRGLRAKLESYSMIPSEVGIEINYYPNTPVHLTHIKTEYPEIPTLETATGGDQIAATLKEIEETFKNLKEITSSPEIMNTIKTINKTATNADKLVTDLNNHVDPVLANLTDALKNTSHAAYSLREFADYVSRHPESLIKGKGN